MTPNEKRALKSEKLRDFYAFQRDHGNTARYIVRTTKNPQKRAAGLPVLSTQHVPRVTARRARRIIQAR